MQSLFGICIFVPDCGAWAGFSGRLNREPGVHPGLCPQLCHPERFLSEAIGGFPPRRQGPGEVRRPAAIKLNEGARGQVPVKTLSFYEKDSHDLFARGHDPDGL